MKWWTCYMYWNKISQTNFACLQHPCQRTSKNWGLGEQHSGILTHWLGMILLLLVVLCTVQQGKNCKFIYSSLIFVWNILQT